jgi:hypothetical protein
MYSAMSATLFFVPDQACCASMQMQEMEESEAARTEACAVVISEMEPWQ